MNDENHWLDRAAEMRVLASTTNDIEAQAAMVRLADVYDKLADRAELRAPPPKSPQQAGRPEGEPSCHFEHLNQAARQMLDQVAWWTAALKAAREKSLREAA